MTGRRVAAAEGEQATHVLIAVGVRFYREGLALALGRRRGLVVVGAVADAPELFAQLERARPDVVLLDLAFGDGLGVARTLRERHPATHLIALSVDDNAADSLAWVEAGVASVVAREGSIADVVASIEATMAGGALVSPRLAAMLLQRVRHLASEASAASGETALTGREREVAALIEDGLSNKQIAAHLSIEVPTVKNHVHNILEKLNVSRRGEAAAELRRSRSDLTAR